MTNVLIIEDQPNLLRSLVQAIREAGMEATGTGSLRQATELCKSPVDLVILDLMQPDGNGLAWLQQFRSEGHSALVLILTAKDSVEDRIAGLDCWADDYVVKPFALSELLARIRALLRRDAVTSSAILLVEDVRIEAELALSGIRSDNEYRLALSVVVEEVSRLGRLCGSIIRPFKARCRSATKRHSTYRCVACPAQNSRTADGHLQINGSKAFA